MIRGAPARVPGQLRWLAAGPPAWRAPDARATRAAAWGLVVAAAGVSAVGVPAQTALARLFFVAIVGGGGIAAAGMAGAAVQAAAAVALLALVTVQRADPRPIAGTPSSLWIQRLETPPQVLRHTMRLPVGTPAWDHLWQRAQPGSAGSGGGAVFVCARGPLEERDGVQLWVNGTDVATITQALAVGPRPQPTSVGFYRVPVDRAVVERAQPQVFELRRAPGASEAPVEVCGTFTYQPTAGIEASAFFDGASWWSPGAAQQGRFQIEWRFQDATGRIFAAYY